MLMLAGCAATAPASNDRVPRPELTPPTHIVAAREALKDEYGAFLRQLFPTYNDIHILNTESDTSETWTELAAIHPFLGPMAFAAGPQKGIIQNWVFERQQRFIDAQISDVSVGTSLSSRSDRTFFEEHLWNPALRPILMRTP